jgi:hypothetical protein
VKQFGNLKKRRGGLGEWEKGRGRRLEEWEKMRKRSLGI